MKLYRFERTWGIPNVSHFCLKTEMHLRMTGIEYEVNLAFPMDRSKGTPPYFEDSDKILGDPAFIVLYLKEKYHDLDKELSEPELAVIGDAART